MNKDDPFGLENDAGRTRIRPVGRTQQSGPLKGRSDPAAPPAGSVNIRQQRMSSNELVNAFSVLLGLAPELERATPPENPEALRGRLLDSLTRARDDAVSAGVPLARADQAAWLVGALLDDIALNTPWGGASGWPRLPLVVSLYGDVEAGARFFDLVDELMRFPERDPEMLEVAFLCLALGFRGKHRLAGPTGDAALTQLRGQMARLLRRPDVETALLSPNWRGVEAEDEPSRFAIPLWSVALIAVAIIAAVYVGLSIRLSERSERLYTLAGVLPPPERAEIFRPVIETVKEPELVLEPVVLELLPLIKTAAPEVTATAISGREDVSLAVVVVQSDSPEVFRSARADVNQVYAPLIGSIASVIIENQEFVGGVTVIGHTDSVPVQRSNPFTSNQGLSEARARTIAGLLVEAGVPEELISFEGRAASEPIADNATKEGRARNRRVEIVIRKKV